MRQYPFEYFDASRMASLLLKQSFMMDKSTNVIKEMQEEIGMLWMTTLKLFNGNKEME